MGSRIDCHALCRPQFWRPAICRFARTRANTVADAACPQHPKRSVFEPTSSRIVFATGARLGQQL